MSYNYNIIKSNLSNKNRIFALPGDTLGLVLSGLSPVYNSAVVTFSIKKGNFNTNLTSVSNILPAFANTGSLSQTLPLNVGNSFTINLTPTQTATFELNSSYALELEFLLSTGIVESWQYAIITGQDIVNSVSPGTPAVNNQRFLGNFATAPITAQSGDNYFNTVNNILYTFYNSIWQAPTGGATNLTYTASPTGGVVNSSTGTGAPIPVANVTNAGLITPGEKAQISAINSNLALKANLSITNTKTGVIETNSGAGSAVALGFGGIDGEFGIVRVVNNKGNTPTQVANQGTGNQEFFIAGNKKLEINTTNISVENNQIKNVGNPTANQDVTSKIYVDTALNTKQNTITNSDSIAQGSTNLFLTAGERTKLTTDKLIVQNNQTASYTLVLTDSDKLVTMTVATANNLTIPLNSTVAYQIGTQIMLSQFGAGQTSIVPTAGVTLNSSLTQRKLANQFATATLIKLGTDTWLLSGNIAV